jgi:hypothetical protein
MPFPSFQLSWVEDGWPDIAGSCRRLSVEVMLPGPVLDDPDQVAVTLNPTGSSVRVRFRPAHAFSTPVANRTRFTGPMWLREVGGPRHRAHVAMAEGLAPDSLDTIFDIELIEHVQSFTCRNERGEESDARREQNGIYFGAYEAEGEETMWVMHLEFLVEVGGGQPSDE